MRQWKHGQWNGKENCENLERNQLWESLINVTLVTELNPEVFDRDPEEDAARDNVDVASKDCACLYPMHLTHAHQEDVYDRVRGVIEEELLEGERRVQWNVQQAKLLVWNVLSVLVDLMRSHLAAFSDVLDCQGTKVDLIQVDHFYLVFGYICLAKLAVLATAASSRASP